jgi:putative flippase GtrA
MTAPELHRAAAAPPAQPEHLLLTALKFGLVGACSVAVYFAALLGLRHQIPQIALLTMTCYVLSAVFNFAAQRGFTFRARRPKPGTLIRYVAQHGILMGLNSVLMIIFVQSIGLPLVPAQFITTATVAAASFGLSYLWVYK